MLATKGLQYRTDRPTPWLAEVTGLHEKYKFSLDFLKYRMDYTHSNAKGDGIVFWYTLQSGKIYRVFEWISRKCDRKYFIRICDDGEIIEIPELEVIKWTTTKST
jgi:hypothetical protein